MLFVNINYIINNNYPNNNYDKKKIMNYFFNVIIMLNTFVLNDESFLKLL